MEDWQKISKKKKFSKIYDKYIEKIYRFIFLKVNSQETAEDLSSEVFSRGWKVIQEGKEIDNIPAFLYQIARNLVTDFYREKGKAKLISTEFTKEIADPQPNLEEKAISSSDLDNIRGALANLKEEYQNVLVWRYIDNFPISDIAKMLNKSEKAIRVMLHRALKNLKNQLK